MKTDMGAIDNGYPTVTSEDMNNNRNESDQESGNDGNVRNINGTSKLFTVARISPSLMLCGAPALRGNSLSELGVTCLITAAPELPPLPLPPSVKYHHTISIRDTSTNDISSHLDRVADIIHQVGKEGGKTLVHCVAGVSRSASLCLGYLVKYQSMTLREAYHHVHEQRPCIRPNSGFFSQLIQFEEQTTGNSTVRMVHNTAAGGTIPDVYEPDYFNTMSYKSRSFGTK